MKNSFRSFLKKLTFIRPRDDEQKRRGPLSTVSCLNVASGRSIGKVRKIDQDSLFTSITRHGHNTLDAEIGLFIVADGMGGHMHGEVASQLAIETASSAILSALHDPELDLSEESTLALLHAAVEQSQNVIMAQQQDMGTTIVVALVFNSRAYIANVGDSRCYLFQNGELEQITNDHSLVNRLIEIGQVTKEEAKDHPQKNVLYKALGTTGNISPDLFTRDLTNGDKLLLCSDGLWGCVDDPVMATVLNNGRTLAENTQELIDLSLQAGGPDNITCVLVERTTR